MSETSAPATKGHSKEQAHAQEHHEAEKVDLHAVSKRAYELYCARNREDGHDVEDWLAAEAELKHSARGK